MIMEMSSVVYRGNTEVRKEAAASFWRIREDDTIYLQAWLLYISAFEGGEYRRMVHSHHHLSGICTAGLFLKQFLNGCSFHPNI